MNKFVSCANSQHKKYAQGITNFLKGHTYPTWNTVPLSDLKLLTKTQLAKTILCY